MPDDAPPSRCSTTAQAVELARSGARIEELYGVPMDVEWARHDGEFCVLQARPITGLAAAARSGTTACG